jgi:hypothetical protein
MLITGASARCDSMQLPSRSRSKPSDCMMTLNGNFRPSRRFEPVTMTRLQQSRLKNLRHMTPLDILSQSGNKIVIDKAHPKIAFVT